MLAVAFRVLLILAPVVSPGIGGQCRIDGPPNESHFVALQELAARETCAEEKLLKNSSDFTYTGADTFFRRDASAVKSRNTKKRAPRATYGRTMHDDRCSSSSLHVSGCESRSTMCAHRAGQRNKATGRKHVAEGPIILPTDGEAHGYRCRASP
jgi:hypothetical protein